MRYSSEKKRSAPEIRHWAINLMKMALYTLAQGDNVPAYVLFMNAGVKLPAGEEQQVIDSLMTLIERGTIVLVCGTCLNFFEIADRLKVGTR